ncbi:MULTISPECIES: hypothetical protein [Bacillus]|uniref:hypothetical protein n=1 Tax=Bacillus TaxID=1386 RepID=UPI00036DFC3A|nr:MULTISPECIES: hypothetical protein [Bacillus]
MLIWFNANGSKVDVQVKVTRTIVGWFNIRIAGGDDNHFVNVSPDRLKELFPGINTRLTVACRELKAEVAEQLFDNVKAVASA